MSLRLVDVMSPSLQALLLAFAVSAALVPICRRLAVQYGAVARPRNDRWHREVIPLLGGIAVAVSFLFGALITGVAWTVTVPVVTVLLMAAVGLVDDLINLKPATKLVAQIALASTLVYFDFRLQWLDSRLLDSLVTVVWVVGLTNAFNLLDNMDGLCAGIAIIVGGMMIVSLATGASRAVAGDQMVFLALLVGAAAGFLVYNYPPASVFMGDSGSLMLGFGLAALTLNDAGVRGSRSDVISAVAGPVFVLLVPIFDTTLVTVSRLLSGRSPAVGGRDHSSHRLVALGLSERSAVFVLWSLAAAGGGIGLLLRQASDGLSLWVGGLFLVAVCMFAVYLSRIRVYDDITAAPGAAAMTPLTGEFQFKRRIGEVILDSCLIVAAYYWAHHLRFEDPEEFLAQADLFYESLPLVLALQLVAFFIAGVYRGVWQHFGLVDAVNVAVGLVLGAVATQFGLWLLYDYTAYSPAVFIIYVVVLAWLVVLFRASLRLMDQFLQRRPRAGRRAVIYGADGAAVAIQQLQSGSSEGSRLLGLVDDNPRLANTTMFGYPVLGGHATLEAMVAAKAVDTVVLVGAGPAPARLDALEALCDANAVQLLRLQISLEAVVTARSVSPPA